MSLLAGIKANQWLDRALAHEAGRLSLFVKDKSGAAPLNFAVLAGNKKAVRRILACDDDAGTLRMSQNDQKIIALHDACIAMNEAIVGLLLERKGREQRLSAYHGGFLPIHGALVIGTGAGALPRLLAECAEEQTLAQTTTGANALMFAVAAGSASGVAALLAVKGTLARQLGARDGRGRTAIDHARNGGNADVVGLIETAMKSLPFAPSSTTASLATRATATPAVACPGNDMPVPLTPCPPAPSAREDAGVSDTEDEPQGE